MDHMDRMDAAKSPFSPRCPHQPTYPEIAVNGALALIMVASSLLSRQVAAQAAAFEKEGGFTERLYKVRSRRSIEP